MRHLIAVVMLIHGTTTPRGPTVATDFLVLNWEFVVVCDLLSKLYVSSGEYNDMFGLWVVAVFGIDDLGVGIWFTAVIHEASHTSCSGGVDNNVFVEPEQIARPHTLSLVACLPFVCHTLTDPLANVFHDHLVLLKRGAREQTPVMYMALPHRH